MLRKTLLVVCVALLWNSLTLAQTSSAIARKFDEFGDIQPSDLIARLDNLAVTLSYEPNSTAFLIVYRTRRDLPGLSNRYAQRMKGYLIASRGLPSERIVIVDGGVASCLSQEFWVVPPGSAPKPREDTYDNSFKPSVYKFDEHVSLLQLFGLPHDSMVASDWCAKIAKANCHFSLTWTHSKSNNF